jgi:drug/metabolite transporter (DMT)-like permease
LSRQARTRPPTFVLSGRPPQDLLKAVFWAMVGLVSFSLTAIAGREAGKAMSAMHMVCYRNAISLVVLVLVLRYLGIPLTSLATRQPWLQWGRALVHFCGQWCWMTALLLIPLIELMAFEFTFPLWVALLAPAMLGEKLNGARISATVIGFVGVLIIILGPHVVAGSGGASGPQLNLGTVLALSCAVFFALNVVGMRYLMREDSPLTILMFMTANHTVLAFILGFSTMRLPSPGVLPWVLLLGLSSLVAHFALAQALAYADATIVAPMDFLRIPLLAVVGVLVYAEPLHTIAILGTALVLAGNVVNFWGERRTIMPSRA